MDYEHDTDTPSWIRKIALLFISLLLILSVSIEMVAFKSTATAFPFSACFVICLFLLSHGLCCFILCIYKIYIINVYDISILTSFPFRQYIPMGIFRSLSISIIFVAISREIEGSLLIIILQTATPISIIMSRFVASISIRSISIAHRTAILLTFIGVTFGFIASYFGNLGRHYIDYKHTETLENAWWYTPIVMAAMLPQSLSILYQQIKLSKYTERGYPMELQNGVISLIQCMMTCLLSPVLIYLSDPETLYWNDWYLFMHQGFLCLFGTDHMIQNTMYCPNGHTQSMIQFIIWLFISISVQVLTNCMLKRTTAFNQRLCVLIGLLFAFICFQIGFPSVLIVNGADAFDECLLLGVLCSFVGSMMLLIDFNPWRTQTVLDSIQFDELNRSKYMKSELLYLRQQHESLSVSQQEIEINVDNIQRTADTHSSSSRSKSLQEIHYHPNEDDASDYVCYLLMEQQKEVIKEQYKSTLKQYNQEQRQRSQSFHSEFYAQKKVNKKKNKRNKKEKKYYMDEQQIQEYYTLLQQEHLRRKLESELQSEPK